MASRWPQRFSPAALMSFSISRSVRYSRGPSGSVNCYIYCHWGVHSGRCIFHCFPQRWLETVTVLARSVTVPIGLQTVTEGKERRSTWVKNQVGTSRGQCPLYPPKAHMCSATRHVRFVPIADIGQLFDHLVGAGESNDGGWTFGLLVQLCAFHFYTQSSNANKKNPINPLSS